MISKFFYMRQMKIYNSSYNLLKLKFDIPICAPPITKTRLIFCYLWLKCRLAAILLIISMDFIFMSYFVFRFWVCKPLIARIPYLFCCFVLLFHVELPNNIYQDTFAVVIMWYRAFFVVVCVSRETNLMFGVVNFYVSRGTKQLMLVRKYTAIWAKLLQNWA